MFENYSCLFQTHYYQPMWTLVGAGVKPMATSGRPTSDVLPKGVKHYPNYLQEFDPERNMVTLDDGQKVESRMSFIHYSFINRMLM